MSESKIQVIEPPIDAREVLEAAWPVTEVEFAYVRLEPGEHGLDVHRRAVIAGIDSLWARHRPSQAVEIDRVHGRRISLDEFYGDWFDRATRRVMGSGTMAVIDKMGPEEPYPRSVSFSPMSGPFIWLDEDDPVPFYFDPPREATGPRGFAEAFVDTVHGKSAAKQNRAFHEVNKVVLGSPGPDTEIYSWNHDWHPYFDDGHEWWGSDAWTVQRDATTIVVIGASATD